MFRMDGAEHDATEAPPPTDRVDLLWQLNLTSMKWSGCVVHEDESVYSLKDAVRCLLILQISSSCFALLSNCSCETIMHGGPYPPKNAVCQFPRESHCLQVMPCYLSPSNLGSICTNGGGGVSRPATRYPICSNLWYIHWGYVYSMGLHP